MISGQCGTLRPSGTSERCFARSVFSSTAFFYRYGSVQRKDLLRSQPRPSARTSPRAPPEGSSSSSSTWPTMSIARAHAITDSIFPFKGDGWTCRAIRCTVIPSLPAPTDSNLWPGCSTNCKEQNYPLPMRWSTGSKFRSDSCWDFAINLVSGETTFVVRIKKSASTSADQDLSRDAENWRRLWVSNITGDRRSFCHVKPTVIK